MSTTIELSIYRELQSATGADFVNELVDTFLEEAPAMLAELRTARTASDADRYRRAAHSLKSNSNTFGAAELGAMARAIELRGLTDDPEHDAAAIAELEAAYTRAAAALRELRRG